MTTLFSDSWARALCAELNGSTEYLAAGAGWEGSILLEWLPETPSSSLRRVYLDLWHGTCKRGA